MDGMEQLIEQKVCQEIECLSIQLIAILDDNHEKLKSYGDAYDRIIYNALFELIINAYQPATISPRVRQAYLRYAEQGRDQFRRLVELLNEYKPQKLYW